MAGEWPQVPLGDLTEAHSPITYGVVKPGDAPADGVLLVRGGDIKHGRIDLKSLRTITKALSEQYRRTILRGGELIVSLVGEPGEVAIVPASLAGANINRAVGLVRLRAGVNPAFVKYFLRSEVGRGSIVSLSMGSVQQVVNLRDLKRVLVPRPGEAVENAIAHILGTLDDKIELNRRLSETLEAMARSLFKSWFVDFDPVRAKAEGRDPGLPKPLANLFPGRLAESELGHIPEGWGIKAIGDLADVVGGSTPSTREPSYWEGGKHAWATPKDLAGLSVPVLLDTERRITDAGLSQVGCRLLPKGAVLLSSRAPIGYLAVAELPVAVNQGFIAMVAKAGTSNLFLLLWASVAHEEIVSRANGSTFLEISKTNFRPIHVVAPSAQVMDAFEELARPLYKRIAECARETRWLAALRDALLPKLVSGELRVSEA
jgi:type I restriction enzyme, S subunit